MQKERDRMEQSELKICQGCGRVVSVMDEHTCHANLWQQKDARDAQKAEEEEHKMGSDEAYKAAWESLKKPHPGLEGALGGPWQSTVGWTWNGISTSSPIPSNPLPGRTPHLCPVCNGFGKVQYDPVDPFRTTSATNQSSWRCKACQGTGVLWG